MKKTHVLSLLLLFSLSAHAREYSDFVFSWIVKFDSAKTMKELKIVRSDFEHYVDSLKTAEASYDSFYLDQAYLYSQYPNHIWRIRFASWQRFEKEQVSQDSMFKLYNDIKKEEQEADLAFFAACQHIEDLASHSRLYKKYLKQKYKYDKMEFMDTIDEKPMPEFSCTTLDGQHMSLFDHRGRYVLLYFWAMDCPPCLEEIVTVREAHNLFQDSLEIFGINADTIKNKWQMQVLRNFISEMDITWPQVADGIDYAIHKTYFVNTWPTIYLINPKGYHIETRGTLRGEKLKGTLHQYIFKK